MSEDNRFKINWINSAGAALGAVSSAVVLSTFGVAGTLIGAAVGSLCISVGGALYAHSMNVAKERLELTRVIAARTRPRSQSAPVGEIRRGGRLDPDIDPVDLAGGEPRRQALRDLPWKRIVAVTAALFLTAMALIVAFELTVGRPVSTFTGNDDSDRRTSIPGVGRPADDSDKSDPDKQKDPPEESPEPTPTEPTPTEPVPTEPTPTEPVPTTPVPTEPVPTTQVPTEPVPTTVAPTEPPP